MKITKSNTKFTVIIPTRERVDTLQWSLKTCTTQNYDNFEIIVSDNFSQDETRRLVESDPDSRIRYINTGKRVSMTSNYEFALSHVTGDYVCIIGDDDGLMPNALNELNELLSNNYIEAISWKKPFYFWNRWHQVERRNTLHIELNSKFEEFDAAKMLNNLLTFNLEQNFHFSELASLYHGFVKAEVINNLRSKSERFFNSSAPDAYSSLAITSAIKKYWHAATPFTIHGISQHSTGFPSDNTKSMQTFLAEEDIKSHQKIKIAPKSASICVAESLLQAQIHLSEARRFSFDVKKLVNSAMREAVFMSPEVYKSIVDSIKGIGKEFNIENYVDQAIAKNPNSKGNSSLVFGYDFIRNNLTLKLNDEKVKNVYDATLICKDLFNRKSKLFYLAQASRYLTNFAKTFGIKNSLQKGMRRVLYFSNFAS